MRNEEDIRAFQDHLERANVAIEYGEPDEAVSLLKTAAAFDVGVDAHKLAEKAQFEAENGSGDTAQAFIGMALNSLNQPVKPEPTPEDEERAALVAVAEAAKTAILKSFYSGGKHDKFHIHIHPEVMEELRVSVVKLAAVRAKNNTSQP